MVLPSMNNEDLLPCPCCGGRAESCYQIPFYYIQCTKCGIRTIGQGENNRGASWIEWNKRQQPVDAGLSKRHGSNMWTTQQAIILYETIEALLNQFEKDNKRNPKL